MEMLQERDNLLCEKDQTRISSHYFSSFFMDKLMDCGNKSYDYDNVKRYYSYTDHNETNIIITVIMTSTSHIYIGGSKKRNVIYSRKIEYSVR